jgi:uncharacterized protein with HEPN domain
LLETDRQRRDALLWNFTVLGEAAGQLSAEVKDRFPDVAWQQPMRLRNRSTLTESAEPEVDADGL